MTQEQRNCRWLVSSALLCLSFGGIAQAAPANSGPTVEQALSYSPVQKDVDYDRASAAETKQCTLKTEKTGDGVGLVLRAADGHVMRMFLDTNGDNAVDRWSYFKDGIEVYRDVDSNFDRKADQYRWLNTAGTRWGIDDDQDGRIDAWRTISPEEISAEVVAAIRERDSSRFARLLLTPKELKSLGMSPAKEQEMAHRLANAQKMFRDSLSRAKDITSDTHWVYFGGTRPGVVPAGTNDSKADVEVYENVVAIVETAGKDGQVPVGAIVRVGNMWRLIDVPDALLAADERQGAFIHPAQPQAAQAQGSPGQPTAAAQKLITQLEVIDKQIIAGADPEQLSTLNDQRATLLRQLAEETEAPADRAQWLRQLADTVVTAVQEGSYEKGVERLKEVYDDLSKKPEDAELAAYFQYRLMQADFNNKQQAPNANFPELQKEWIENLEKFVNENQKSADAADAMLHLAIANENAGDEQAALKWYGEIVTNFPTAASHGKAKGAQRRLQSVGKPISLQAKSVRGKPVDLSQYKNKVVLIQYWATWCEPCKADMAQLKELLSKYGKYGFEVIGVNLNSDPQDLAEFLKENELPWQQIWEKGGLDSPLANELGIVVVPTAILIDREGKVANRDAHVSQLENDLKTLLGRQSEQGAKSNDKKVVR